MGNKNSTADVNILLLITITIRRGSQDYLDVDVCAQGSAYSSSSVCPSYEELGDEPMIMGRMLGVEACTSQPKTYQ